MGVEHFVSCKTCKVRRSLDKFYDASIWPVNNRAEAKEFSERIAASPFKPGLLVSFVGKHMGHDVVFFNEHSPCYEDLSPVPDWAEEDETERWNPEFTEDADFWSEPVS